MICYAHVNHKGYARLKVDGKDITVSRLIMHLMTDFDLDSDEQVLHVDELCTSKACIEFNHLKIGTSSDNAIDRIIKHGGYCARSTHCPQGHAYTGKVNTYGYNVCLVCQRVAWAKSNQKRKTTN